MLAMKTNPRTETQLRVLEDAFEGVTVHPKQYATHYARIQQFLEDHTDWYNHLEQIGWLLGALKRMLWETPCYGVFTADSVNEQARELLYRFIHAATEV